MTVEERVYKEALEYCHTRICKECPLAMFYGINGSYQCALYGMRKYFEMILNKELEID